MNSELVKIHPGEICLMRRLEVTHCKDCPKHNKECMTTRIMTVCSYCHKVMGFKDGLGMSGISRGICEECNSKL